MTSILTPLTPVDCDLRDFAFMPLDVVRLRDSDLAIQVSGEEFRAAVLLWCASWHQIPAASLPNDERTLAQLAGFGRVVTEWKKVCDGALRGWIECADGRLYHPVVAEKARDAWLAKLKQRFKTECARIKKHCQRHEIPYAEPDFDEWVSAGCPQGQALTVPKTTPKCPEDKPKASPRQIDDVPAKTNDVPREIDSKGQGEGQGQGQGELLKPKAEQQQASAVVGSTLPSDGSTPASRSIDIAVYLRQRGVVGANSANPYISAWGDDARVTNEILDAAISKARASLNGKQLGPNYLATIVPDLLNPAPAKAQKQRDDWHRSDAGISRKASELGLVCPPGKDYAWLRERCEAELRRRAQGVAA
jgi:hypothetical protein